MKNKFFKIATTITPKTHHWANDTLPIGTIVQQVKDTKNLINPIKGIVVKSEGITEEMAIPYSFLNPEFEYKKTILVLHGFNSAPGNKEAIIKEWLDKNNLTNQYNLIAPQLSHSPSEAIKQIGEIIQEHYGNIFIIGTSLGGFYANYVRVLNPSDDIKVHAINPSWSPSKTLKQELNKKQVNFKTGAEWKFSNVFLNYLSKFETDCKREIKSYNGSYYTLHLSNSDELLDFTEMKTDFAESNIPHKIFYYDTNHRFEKVEEMLDNIKEELI